MEAKEETYIPYSGLLLAPVPTLQLVTFINAPRIPWQLDSLVRLLSVL
jgi:hypothetical protein